MDVRFPGLGQFPASGPAGAAGAPGRLASGAGVQTRAEEAGGFAGALDNALHGVSRLQGDSAELQRKFQLGVDGASLEQTMVAMQRSQVAFQAALTVRNRLVAAYTDIMNMPV